MPANKCFQCQLPLLKGTFGQGGGTEVGIECQAVSERRCCALINEDNRITKAGKTTKIIQSNHQYYGDARGQSRKGRKRGQVGALCPRLCSCSLVVLGSVPGHPVSDPLDSLHSEPQHGAWELSRSPGCGCVGLDPGLRMLRACRLRWRSSACPCIGSLLGMSVPVCWVGLLAWEGRGQLTQLGKALGSAALGVKEGLKAKFSRVQ